jgi:hypothetical protein
MMKAVGIIFNAGFNATQSTIIARLQDIKDDGLAQKMTRATS